jgi:hypothetical protein
MEQRQEQQVRAAWMLWEMLNELGDRLWERYGQQFIDLYQEQEASNLDDIFIEDYLIEEVIEKP